MSKKRTRPRNRVVVPAPDRRRMRKIKKLTADAHKRYGSVFRRLAN